MPMPLSALVGMKLIIPPGRPRFLELTAQPKHIIIQTNPMSAIVLSRHYDDASERTVYCDCDPHCSSWREDTFVSAMEWIGPLTFEQRVLVISDAALQDLWRFVKLRTNSLEWAGVELEARRTGSHRNARVCFQWRQKHASVPTGFDMPWAVMKLTNIPVKFFNHPHVAPEVPNDGIMVTPIRARADKPHIPLGTPRKK